MADAKKTYKTPEGRVSFPNCFKGSLDEKGRTVFDITLLFDKKTCDLSQIKKLINDAVVAKWPVVAKRPKLTLPIRDGDVDKPNLDGYPGNWFITFRRRDTPPGVIDANRNILTTQSSEGLYAGCYAVVSFDAYAYENDKKKGVSLGLYNVMKVREGEPFSSANVAAEDDFADYTPKPATAEDLL